MLSLCRIQLLKQQQAFNDTQSPSHDARVSGKIRNDDSFSDATTTSTNMLREFYWTHRFEELIFVVVRVKKVNLGNWKLVICFTKRTHTYTYTETRDRRYILLCEKRTKRTYDNEDTGKELCFFSSDCLVFVFLFFFEAYSGLGIVCFGFLFLCSTCEKNERAIMQEDVVVLWMKTFYELCTILTSSWSTWHRRVSESINFKFIVETLLS